MDSEKNIVELTDISPRKAALFSGLGLLVNY